MLASVFFCQPIGQLLGMIVSLVVISASRKWIQTDSEVCKTDECIRALDSAWRWIVGFGSIPAIVALFFRLTIPESPRYLLDVVGAVKTASQDTQDYYNGDAFGQSQELLEAGQNSQDHIPFESPMPQSTTQGTRSPSPDIGPVIDGGEGLASTQSLSPSPHVPSHQLPSPMLAASNDDISYAQSKLATMHVHSVSSAPCAEPASSSEQQPPKASWQDAKHFFIEEKNWIYFLATSSSWLCLDVSLTALFDL